MKWNINISGPSKLGLEQQKPDMLEALRGIGPMDDFVTDQSPIAGAVRAFVAERGLKINGSGFGMGRWDFDVYVDTDEAMIKLVEELNIKFSLQRKKSMVWWICRDRVH
jgi:hypothetical protein